MNKTPAKLAISLFIGLSVTPIQAQWTWTGCPNVTDADFDYTNLVTAANTWEPVAMDFDMDANGNVDIYFVELDAQSATDDGKVKRYVASTNTVQTLATLPAWRGPYTSVNNGGNIEEGVTGIVLDPNFKTNRYIYIHWSPASVSTYRISRFTLSGNTLPLNTEKILLDFPMQRNECCHTGGGMMFDAYGDLWIAQGANGARGTSAPGAGINETTQWQSEEWGASSTAGLRGGVLRIHPDNSAKGYTIPAGNFGDYFATQTGNAAYRDTARVKPEIYVKGGRNPYRLSVDPVRRWLFWGDVGPDAGGTMDENNISLTPGFYGWPYFQGNNTVYSLNKNPAAPTNTSVWNNGLQTLPAAIPCTQCIGHSSTIAGPLYRYDGDLQSSVKLPPHFTRKWFITNWSTNQVQVLTLNAGGTAITNTQRIFANTTFYGPTDLKAGPDGALYVVNYNGLFSSGGNQGIVKIEYTGTCRPADPKLEQPVTVLDPGARNAARTSGWVLHLGSGRPIITPDGMAAFELYDMMGRKVWEIKRLRAGQSFTLPANSKSQAMKYRWVTALP